MVPQIQSRKKLDPLCLVQGTIDPDSKVGPGTAAAVAARHTTDHGDTSDDFLIAQMLQKQFDKEYDMALTKVGRTRDNKAGWP